MHYLFLTLQHIESEFYGRVSLHLAARGHEVTHITFSRHSARRLRERGLAAHCLPEVMALVGEGDVASEVRRIERQYATPTIRDVYKTDLACDGKPEDWCVRRTVRHFRALEHICEAAEPEIIVPEVGSETMRTAAHLIGLHRRTPVLFLFYTIFPDPLRLYTDTMHAPIVQAEELRPLAEFERQEIEQFIHDFTLRATPIRPHRRRPVSRKRLGVLVRHFAVAMREDRDNEYLQPMKWMARDAKEYVRALSARGLYRHPDGGRPFVYFPLHVTDDYKIKRVIPHCVHQEAIIERIADALPHGYDLVLKEHPMSVGRNPLSMLRGLARIPNVRLVSPFINSHFLMKRAEAVAVISSTVGLEALMYEKPVLTVGQPFYSGYGLTLDVDSFAEIREKVPAVLRGHRPDREEILRFLHAAMRRCYPGAPALVDQSDENAEALARSLDRAASAETTVSPVPAQTA